ncbi:SDR family oxidoreductase [Membranihabitans maritimus]|uniref:SDR family oxidoreductase n=1 Tax=Membranihabitans maritimus TaxID=2904244 RepID=UPI001F31B2E2|nr:SDR family oxidoreductase [Membranihabitans maritimus]
MKILLTGATGYIGKRLLPLLLSEGHEVICCVRDLERFQKPNGIRGENVTPIEVDFLNRESLRKIPKDIDAAYYLIHSMSSSAVYKELELQCASNFKDQLNKTEVNHVIYLSGIANQQPLSNHLESRLKVEKILNQGLYHFTALRAGIIIGSGSASFEIIRDLVEKLPVMIAPKWLKTKCQPIAIIDVLSMLIKTLNHPETFNKNFDIGSPDILTYKQMLMEYARVRNLKRIILTVPVMTPKLSSYWLYFVTSTSYKLATALVESMKVEVTCRNNTINTILDHSPISYNQALKRTFSAIESNAIVSSWKDSLISGRISEDLSEFINVPTFGCFKDKRQRSFQNRESCIKKLWSIGGDTGWYYGNFLWRIRGTMDKLSGGVGLRRGRTNPNQINSGDVVDFWRVIYANQEEGRLLLFAEMKLPGEAWLDFQISDNQLIQTATFRPKGIAGRLYWYAVLPFHGIIFTGLIKKLTEK